METIIMSVAALVAVAVVIYMLIKKLDITIAMFLMGICLMYVSMGMGKDIALQGFKSTGVALLDPLQAIAMQFKSSLNSAGFIILVLGGYAAFMNKIGANEITVSVLTKPVSKIKSPYVLVPFVFLLGNLLSLVIPSASNLAIILLATLYPILTNAGMSTLTAAGIIATTATVMPTPLGSDNVAIVEELIKYPAYSGMTVTDYVFRHHTLISIPTLFFMALVHYFWQKYMDKKESAGTSTVEGLKEIKPIEGGTLFKTVYAILPLFPILMFFAVFIASALGFSTPSLSVEIVVFVSYVLAIICEIIRHRSGKKALDNSVTFFTGMGNGLPIVALLVAATVFVTGLQSIGLIDALRDAMQNIQGSGLGFVLPLTLVGFTALIVLLSGSGTSLFFAMVPLMVPLADAAGINPFAVTIPMGLAGNLLRAVSPVAAVVMIVSGSVKKAPLEIVKRTSIPMIAGTVFMFILSMIMFI